MKYAFVVLIVIYLITYGCSSEEQKPEVESAKNAETITVENKQPAAPAVAAEPAVQAGEQAQPVAAEPVVEQPVVPQQPEKAVTEPQQAEKAATEPQPADRDLADTAQQPLAEEQEALLIGPEDLVIMPCGRAFIREDVPCDLPCMPQQEEPMMHEGPMAQEEPAVPQTMPGQPPAATPQDQLTGAMQKMVEATNAMVIATREMAVATREMLKATQGTAEGMIDSTTNSPEAKEPKAAEQPAQPVQPAEPAEPTDQAVQPQAQAPASAQSPEQAVVESLKNVAIAAQAALDATGKAIPLAETHQHHQ